MREFPVMRYGVLAYACPAEWWQTVEFFNPR